MGINVNSEWANYSEQCHPSYDVMCYTKSFNPNEQHDILYNYTYNYNYPHIHAMLHSILQAEIATLSFCSIDGCCLDWQWVSALSTVAVWIDIEFLLYRRLLCCLDWQWVSALSMVAVLPGLTLSLCSIDGSCVAWIDIEFMLYRW